MASAAWSSYLGGVQPGEAGDVGCGWGSGVVCSYNVILCDWISFKILFRFHIAVESRVEVAFSLRSYLTIIF